ncbi:MAG: carboxypeptidase Q [Planctomycetota bacterium]|jgi:carboxypeptidase Q
MKNFMRPTTIMLLASCVLLLADSGLAQKKLAAKPEVVSDVAMEVRGYRTRVREMIRTSLKRGQAYEHLREMCEKVPKRVSGSPGAAAAVLWAKQLMERLEFDNVHLEEVMVPHWEPGTKPSLAVTVPANASATKLPFTPLGGSVPTPLEGITAEVMEVQSIGELRKREKEAKGKIVFFNRPMDMTLLSTGQAYGGAVRQRTRGAAEAGAVGAVAVIVRSVSSRRDDAPHTGAMNYQDGVKKIPAGAVSMLGADRLSALLKKQKKVQICLKLDSKWYKDELSYNVVGELTGSEKPEEILVVGGHLDAWSTGDGAHDDGAGCMHSVEALRLIKEMGYRPKRTIRCVLFMNEENGLRGGRAYYKAHLDEMDKHVLALESDSGGFTPRGFTTDAHKEAKVVLEEIAQLLVNAGAGKVYAGGGGADISPMRASGVLMMGYRPDSHRYFDLHHSKHDVFSSVNEREIELGSACIATMLFIVADLKETLKHNPIPAKK